MSCKTGMTQLFEAAGRARSERNFIKEAPCIEVSPCTKGNSSVECNSTLALPASELGRGA